MEGHTSGPVGVYHTTLEWLNYRDNDNDKAVYKEMTQESTSFRLIPITIEDSIHWKLEQATKTSPPPSFVIKMKEGRIVSYNGAILSNDDYLIWDLSIEFIADRPEDHFLLKEMKLPPLRKTNQTVAALTFCASQYYYHWLFDVLPRFYLLEQMGIEADWYAINWNGRPVFQDETLDLIGIDKAKIIDVTETTNLEVQNLYVPSLTGYSGHMAKWTVDFLREQVMDPVVMNKEEHWGDFPRRIYISRGGASTRNVKNEDAVIKLLKRYGFTSIKLEGKSVTEQILLFNHASVVVGPHGSGLTNLTFCKEGTKVIELFSPNYVHTCYWILSNHTNLNYGYLIGKGERPPDYCDPNAVHQDIEIDLADLEKLLEKMGVKN